MNGDDETPWTIQMSRPAQKALRRLPSERDRLLRGISALPAGDVVRLQGTTDEFRLRIGDWRVRFRLDYAQRCIVVVAIAPRGRAYRGL